MIPTTEKDPNRFIRNMLIKKLADYGDSEDAEKILTSMDSLDVVELAMKLEHDLEISISDHQVSLMRGLSIDRIADMLVENYSTQHRVNNGKG